MAEPSHAVFLSYTSQDADAAEKICEALRAGGIEVFLDRSELRGGDAWDQRIRHEIHDCALFIPVISRHTQQRLEGYFRHEWNLAIERSHHMAEQKRFLVPVVIDATGDREALVPDAFRAVQWTRLPGGGTTAAFVERIQRLLSPQLAPRSDASGSAPVVERAAASRRSRWVLLASIAACAALAYVVADRLWIARRATATSFAPPAHSIAVLPFVNLSGDPGQEYFSDGLTEELLNSLAAIDGLQVAARTSSFSFKEHPDIVTVAHKLNVGSVLEGSVRRSEHTVRVTAQLINAVSGFHLWSKTYDRDLGDVLQLQTEIATAVAESLKVTLLGEVALKIELGGTRNPVAFDAYLRGLKLARIAEAATPMECAEPVAAFGEAVGLDPNFALAFANRSLIFWDCVTNTPQWLQQSNAAKARADAERAIELTPALAEAHVALSGLEQGLLNLAAADRACARAMALAPGNDLTLYRCSLLAVYMGHTDTAISGARRGVALDPLNPLSHRALGDTLRYARRYDEAVAAYTAAIGVDPEHAAETYALRGISYYLAGNLRLAQSSCEARPDYFRSELCRAMVYHKLGRQADAAAALAKMRQAGGEAAAYQYTEVYAQWGDRNAALDWVEKTMRLRDPGLIYLKTDPLLDPLRAEPRFQAVERELKFPD